MSITFIEGERKPILTPERYVATVAISASIISAVRLAKVSDIDDASAFSGRWCKPPEIAQAAKIMFQPSGPGCKPFMHLFSYVILLAFCLGPTQGSGPRSLPNSSLTPGATLDVTKEDVCTTGYSRKVRNGPAAVKRHVFDLYNVIYVPKTYESGPSHPA